MRTPGVLVENTSSVSPACRKRRLYGAMCRNQRIKRWYGVGVGLVARVRRPRTLIAI